MSLRRHALRPPAHVWLRVAHPSWTDPLDGSFAARHGGRWNPPGSWPTLYLCRDVDTARAQIDRLLDGSPVDPEDLSDDAFVLVGVRLPPADVADIVTAAGVRAAGLPAGYPKDHAGRPVPHEACQSVGSRAYAEGADGVEERSAWGPSAGPGTEVAWWSRDEGTAARVGRPLPYGRWRRGGVEDMSSALAAVEG